MCCVFLSAKAKVIDNPHNGTYNLSGPVWFRPADGGQDGEPSAAGALRSAASRHNNDAIAPLSKTRGLERRQTLV
jgi:hypothetical protein